MSQLQKDYWSAEEV